MDTLAATMPRLRFWVFAALTVIGLAPREHTVSIIASGDAARAIDGFWVFE